MGGKNLVEKKNDSTVLRKEGKKPGKKKKRPA